MSPREWRRLLTAKAATLRSAGHDVEIVDAPAHRFGCYLVTSPSNIRRSHVAAMVDERCPIQYDIREEVVPDRERTMIRQESEHK